MRELSLQEMTLVGGGNDNVGQAAAADVVSALEQLQAAEQRQLARRSRETVIWQRPCALFRNAKRITIIVLAQ